MRNHYLKIFFITVIFTGAALVVYADIKRESVFTYSIDTTALLVVEENIFIPTHIKTPENVRAIYMTSWVAGTKNIREKVISLIEETELNSVVIDIKDYSGKLAFKIEDPRVGQYHAAENRIPDIKEFIEELHKKGIYVIGRVTVFQDPHLANLHPEFAVLRESDKSIWKDYKGLSFTDPGERAVWDYHVAIAEGSYNLGFDEINFDYIRFPSDGNMKDIYYQKSEDFVLKDPDFGKAKVMESFFSFLKNNLKDSGIIISADIFGMTTTNYDDLNIGQVLEKTEPYFDYVAPMVYPSHYPTTFIGFGNPAAYPYEVVKYSLESAHERMLSASSTPEKIRPWLQDFDLGADYTPEMVRAQINATYDAGFRSWMLWDPANTYTKEALKPFYVETSTTTRAE